MNETASWDPEFEGILRQALPRLSSVAPDICLREHGLDSLATIDLLLRLEEHYTVSIPDELLSGETFATPASLWRVVTRVRDAARQPVSLAATGDK